MYIHTDVRVAWHYLLVYIPLITCLIIIPPRLLTYYGVTCLILNTANYSNSLRHSQLLNNTCVIQLVLDKSLPQVP